MSLPPMVHPRRRGCIREFEVCGPFLPRGRCAVVLDGQGAAVPGTREPDTVADDLEDPRQPEPDIIAEQTVMNRGAVRSGHWST